MRKAPTTKTTPKIREETTFGDEVLNGLNDFFDAVKAGEPITVRKVKLNLIPAKYTPGAEAV